MGIIMKTSTAIAKQPIAATTEQGLLTLLDRDTPGIPAIEPAKNR
jgi:alpha-D-ribose 1-methylphosphonate 5-triphosphate synthase subunit PhnH